MQNQNNAFLLKYVRIEKAPFILRVVGWCDGAG